MGESSFTMLSLHINEYVTSLHLFVSMQLSPIFLHISD